MFLGFLEELRRRKVPVGTHEAVALAGALSAGLHDSSLDGFYNVARSLLVHSEVHLDAFDQAFAHHFRGAPERGLQLHQELLDWLREAKKRRPQLTPDELALLERLDPETLERMFRERLAAQKERHDGGSRFIGTGGTSPFGRAGARREGIVVGEGGQASALARASARQFRGYRDDLILDTRQLQVALRKLRAFAREGLAEELDLEGTINQTAKNAGELEVVTRAPRRPNTRVILLMDVGGSMDPYAELVSRLFSAAAAATHFKDLRTYYFHNCVYGRLYTSPEFKEAIGVPELLNQCGKNYKLILVGDALMSPYELLERGGPRGLWDDDAREGASWLMMLAEHFPHSAWLNPEPRHGWYGTAKTIQRIFPMFPLTVEGLGEAVTQLIRGAFSARR